MRRTIFITLTLLLSGCATYHAQPVVPSRLAQQFETRSFANADLRAFLAQELGHNVAPWPMKSWSRELLTLAAYYYSPGLDVARAQWAVARAGIEAAGAAPNPTLQLPFQYSTPNPGPGSPFTYGPALDIPIETAGKRGYRVKQASHFSEAARLSIAGSAWKVQSEVRNAWLALYAARERVRYLRQKAGTEAQIVEMVEKRQAVGESSRPDVDTVMLALAQAKSDLVSSRSAEQDARARLAAAVGVPESALDAIQINFSSLQTAPPPPPGKAACRAAVFHRADLRASLADYAAAESALQLEIAKQYPDIHLGPGYTYDTGTQKFAFGLVGISLPIFDRNQGGIAQAEAKRKEAAARTEALQDGILGDLDHALVHYQTSLDALRLAGIRQTVAKRQLDSQAAGFASGDTDRLAYARAKANYETGEIAHLDATVAAWAAAGMLEDAIRRPLRAQAANESVTEQEIQR